MKKISIILIILAMCFCNGVAISVIANPTIEKIEITEEITMTIGDINRVDILKVLPEGYSIEEDVIWTTSDESVVTVDGSGNIRAAGVGEATITATYKELKDTCSVKVLPIDVTSVSVGSIYSAIHPLEEMQMSIIINPDNATYKNVVWSSSDSLVATVSETGLVRGVNEGQAIITATVNGVVQATKTIHVKNVIELESFQIGGGSSSLEYGDSYKLWISKEPANADIGSVTWESSDSSVIDIDTDGKITVKKDGSSIITATLNDGQSKTIVLSVPRVEAKYIRIELPSYIEEEGIAAIVNQGNTVQLSVLLFSDIMGDKKVTTREIEWTSSDPSKVSVTADGLITAIQKTATEFGADFGVTITAKVKGLSGSASVMDMITIKVK